MDAAGLGLGLQGQKQRARPLPTPLVHGYAPKALMFFHELVRVGPLRQGRYDTRDRISKFRYSWQRLATPIH
jgi:hypothetical protein